jgi:DNA-binding NarL/FixJ family response regulator
MITVVIAESNETVRLGLRVLLEADSQISILADAGIAFEVLSSVQDHKPSVLVLEWRMPDAYASEFLPKISQSSPMTKILIISTWTAGDFEVPLRGAPLVAGYVSKDEAEHLVTGVREVAAGRQFTSPNLAKRLSKGGRPLGAATRRRAV